MGQFCKEHDRVQETGKMLAAFAHPNVKANLDSILVLSTSLEIPNPVSQHMLPTHSNDLVPGAGPGLRCLIKEVSNGLRPQHGTSDSEWLAGIVVYTLYKF